MLNGFSGGRGRNSHRQRRRKNLGVGSPNETQSRSGNCSSGGSPTIRLLYKVLVMSLGDSIITRKFQKENIQYWILGHKRGNEKFKRFGMTDFLNTATWNVRGRNGVDKNFERDKNQHNSSKTKKKLRGIKEVDQCVVAYNGIE